MAAQQSITPTAITPTAAPGVERRLPPGAPPKLPTATTTGMEDSLQHAGAPFAALNLSRPERIVMELALPAPQKFVPLYAAQGSRYGILPGIVVRLQGPVELEAGVVLLCRCGERKEDFVLKHGLAIPAGEQRALLLAQGQALQPLRVRPEILSQAAVAAAGPSRPAAV